MKTLLKIKTRYLLITVFLFMVVLSLQVFAKRSGPDLTDVLQGHKASFDLSYLMIGFFALSLATLSFAKGYELLTRPKKEEKNSELDILKEENCRYFELNARTQKENEDITRQILRLESAFREKAGQEEVLAKNASSLKKEFEKLQAEKNKLLAEKEALNLELNQKSIFEIPKMPAPEAVKARQKRAEAKKAKKPVNIKRKAHSTHKKKGVKK